MSTLGRQGCEKSKVALAMRPDLIVVGEVRGAEAFELTRAVNAGWAMITGLLSVSPGLSRRMVGT